MTLNNFGLPLEFCDECSSENPLNYGEPKPSDSFFDVVTVFATCPDCPAEYELEFQVDFKLLKMRRR